MNGTVFCPINHNSWQKTRSVLVAIRYFWGCYCILLFL